ncbi:VCBS repeat-containing protein [Clostridium sp.]|uniref:VCBS repeat-containing protein n=1 Tax=Clostridium sp. TaxID=1506 RepID=UPI003D6D660B
MKNKKLILLTIFLSSLIIAGPITSAQGITKPKLQNYKIDSLISIPKLNLSKNTYISDYKYVDITGDNVKDNVILTGTKAKKADIYFENLSIIVQNGKSKKFIRSSLGKYNGGYQPTVFLGDFNGDKVPDIFVKMPTGGSGGFIDYSIIKFKEKKLSVLWNSQNYNSEIDLTGKFEDNFMVNLSSKKLNKTFVIDLSPNKIQYIDSNIYDKDGKIKQSIEPWMDGFSEITPIDTDKNGTYELIAYQRIVGTCNADTLGYLKSEWKWDGKNIKLDTNKVSLKHIH